ncbi:MAG: type III pantothenate kinase [bacterium]
MLLVIDIGNTNIVLGIFGPVKTEGRPKPVGRDLVTSFRIKTEKLNKAAKYGSEVLRLFKKAGIGIDNIEGIIISSVVPPLVKVFREVCVKYLSKKPMVFEAGKKSPMKILYDKPAEVGSDRIANSYAAFKLYKKPAIIVDFGTATTFDVVTKNGEYAGGVIAPGMGVSAQALFLAASKLPHITIKRPRRVLGKNTVQSMQSGFFYGTVGQVREIICELRKKMRTNPLVIATGGYASLISSELPLINLVRPALTLEGLALIYKDKIEEKK